MCHRKVWGVYDRIDDFFDSCSFGILWWPGIEEHKVLSDISVCLITGKSIRWHEEKLVENELIQL